MSEKLINNKMRCDQMQAIDVYFNELKNDATILPFLEEMQKKLKKLIKKAKKK